MFLFKSVGKLEQFFNSNSCSDSRLEIINYLTIIEPEGFNFILALREWILFLKSKIITS